MEEGALEEAAGVGVFFTSGEKQASSRGNGALYGAAWLPAPAPGVGVGRTGRTGDCCSGLSMAVLLQACPGLHAPVSTCFPALFLITMNWVLAWLEASLPPSCQLVFSYFFIFKLFLGSPTRS